MLGCIMFVSCSKEENVQINDDHEKNSIVSKNYLTKSEVITSMSNIGAILKETPIGYAPSFDGAVEILIFEFGGTDYYHVYVWNNPDDDDFTDALSLCTKFYHPNGDCYDNGNTCDVEIRDGKCVIICCDDPV